MDSNSRKKGYVVNIVKSEELLNNEVEENESIEIEEKIDTSSEEKDVKKEEKTLDKQVDKSNITSDILEQLKLIYINNRK